MSKKSQKKIGCYCDDMKKMSSKVIEILKNQKMNGAPYIFEVSRVSVLSRVLVRASKCCAVVAQFLRTVVVHCVLRSALRA